MKRLPPLPQGIGNRCNGYLLRQRKLDENWKKGLETLHENHVNELEKMREAARAERLVGWIDLIEAEIEASGADGESFQKRLDPGQSQ